MSYKRVELTDEEHNLINGVLNDEHSSNQEWFKDCTVSYTLAPRRVSNFLRVVLLSHLAAICALWLSGGDGKHFIDSMKCFTMTGSVFDLAVISVMKWLLVFFLSIKAENHALENINRKLRHLPVAAVISAVIVIASLIFSIVKGSLMLYDYVDSHQNIPKIIYSTAITDVILSLLEALLLLPTIRSIKNIDAVAVKHIYNKKGIELDKNGEPIKRGADLKRLIALAKPEAPLIITGCFCLLVTSGSSIAAPYFFGEVVDAAQTSMAALNKTVIILFLIYTLYGIAGFFRSWFFTLAGQKIVARIRILLFSAIIKQDIEFFDVSRTGELTNRLSSDTQAIQSAVTENLSMLLRNFIQICGSLVVMFVLDPALTGILLAVVPVISLSAVQYGNFMKKLRKEFQDKLADAGTVAEESISSIRTVRTFNGEKKSTESYHNEIMKSYAVAKKVALLNGIFYGWVSIASFGAICLAMWYGGKLVFEKQLSVGILTSFLVYTVQIAASLAVVSSLYGEFMQAVGASQRMFDILDKIPKVVVDESCSTEPSQFSPDIAFEDVHFTYPTRPDSEVLKGVSLSIEPGKVVALVGPSGGGKSTIVSLIERFYDINKGTVKISGINVKCLDPLWYRKKISLVSQEPTLFACSIKDNIAYGMDASMEQIIEAAKQANAHSFIELFKDGYDTLVGERGVRLSGGQKQRIAIARSLITNPSILLLDEATSALDAESEQLVQQAIDRAMTGRTVLIIAHRLSTVRNADQVVVIDKGVIAEQGTHNELIQKDGVYKRLVLKQLEAGNTNVPDSSSE